MTAGFVVSDDEQIYYEVWGEGDETIVFSHGMGGNHAVWYQQVAHFASRYRVVTWDQRGFGRSTGRSGVLGPEPAVTDLARLLDHLGVAEAAHLVGQSMGGWAVLGFAGRHPERTLSLVLADTTGGIFTTSIRKALEDYGKIINSGPPPSDLPLGRHPAVGEQLLEEDIALSFLYGQLGSLTTPPSPSLIVPLLLDTDNTELGRRLAMPTLFVVGEHDPIFPPALVTHAAELVLHSKVAIVENTGHSPYFERAPAWNDTVSGFLADSDRR